jgi:chaperonin GroEL (HSP60 family)
MDHRMEQLFGDGLRRSQEGESRRYNLLAAALIADLVKNSLGPCGLEKVYIDIMGEITVTKDGSAILRKLDVEHPAAKILIEAANSVDNEVGDGTTSVVILTGELLSKAQELLLSGIAPSVIIDGYLMSLDISLQALNQISVSSTSIHREVMKKLAETCLQTRSISDIVASENNGVADLVVEAVRSVADLRNKTSDVDDIKIEEKLGNSSDTTLIRGTVIDKTFVASPRLKQIQNAKILLTNEELDRSRAKINSELNISSFDQLERYYKSEYKLLETKVQNIIDSCADVVISQRGINKIVQQSLSRANITALHRVKENDMLWLEKSTGARVVKDLNDPIPPDNLGYAGKVYEKLVGDDRMVFIDECKNPKSVTLLLRANSKRVLDEYHRSVLDGIAVLRDYIISPRIVGGAGATEMKVASIIRDRSRQITGRVQLVLQKFAEALEEIPITLARNAGMDTLNTITQLRSKCLPANSKVKWYGIDPKSQRVANIISSVIEPSIVKEQVLKTAVEVTCMLLRVDDVLVAKPKMQTHTHADGVEHSHPGGDKKHDHYFDRLGKQQRPMHHYY